MTTITNVSKNDIIANDNHVGRRDTATLRGRGAPTFPSLSKGTLKSTSNIINPYFLTTSLTKIYPEKVKFFLFKTIKKTSIIDASSPFELSPQAQSTAEIVRTPEQILDTYNRSIARTRRELTDLVECNDFDKFGTLTFDPKKHPKCNDREYATKKVIQWLNNQQKLHGAFNYILNIEQQDNGNYHFHALLGGFTGKYHATNVRGVGEARRQCYKLNSWEKTNGFADMEDISDKVRLANYLLKYITKDMTSTLVVKGKKRYYASKNLMRPEKAYNQELSELVASGDYAVEPLDTYENDYVVITTLAKI